MDCEIFTNNIGPITSIMDSYFIRILISFLILHFSSCDNQKHVINGEQLGGGYFCFVDGFTSIEADNLFKPSIYGDVKAYAYNGDYILIKQEPNREHYKIRLSSNLSSYRIVLSSDSLECTPEEYQFYQKLIAQNKDSVNLLFSSIPLEDDPEYIQKKLKIADSLIENDAYYKSIFQNKVNYWIISHKQLNENDYMVMPKIYGPYKKGDFLIKLEELGVPQELRLVE